MSGIERVEQLIEQNHPPITSLALFLSKGAKDNNESRYYAALYPKKQWSKDYVIENDTFTSPLAWRRLGAAIRKSTTISTLTIERRDVDGWESGEDYDEDDVANIAFNVEAIQCLSEFYKEIVHCTSICGLTLDLFSTAEGPYFDLSRVVQSSKYMSHLLLGSVFSDPLLPEQCTMVADVLRNCTLTSLDVSYCYFDDASFMRIIPSCAGIEELSVNALDYDSVSSSKCIAISALIQDPEALLTSLTIDDSPLRSDQVDLLVQSLAGNTKLTKVKLVIHQEPINVDKIDSLLCDSSSISNIQTSNHTLKELVVTNHNDCEILLPTLTKHLLSLNHIPNKRLVIRRKISMYYFKGNFELDPLLKMSVTLLPGVFDLIREGGGNQVNAMFRLLKNIPDLCNVTSRVKVVMKKPRLHY
eukprot:scaffold1350_cov56-Cyclotella_meneghiniana.AAC.16